MAFICVTCFPKCSTNLVLLRFLKHTYCEQKLIQASPKSLINSKEAPVKFTTNQASTIKIAETIGLHNKDDKKKYSGHIVFASLGILLLYFCCLREENDVDEILKGNQVHESDEIKLLKLKMQLQYCEKSNLPTEKLRAKIREYEDKQKISYAFTK